MTDTPEFWPPKPGDLWEDEIEGGLWLAREDPSYGRGTMMVPVGATACGHAVEQGLLFPKPHQWLEVFPAGHIAYFGKR